MNLEGVMDRPDIYITEFDRTRLKAILESPAFQTGRDREHLADLAQELEKAHIVKPEEVPADVVTMNSKVRVRDMQSGEMKDYTLVFPHQADISQDKISVLAPIGTALLGYRAGDTVELAVPDGTRVLKVESVLYQPEASGDFHL
jgi:regulator of nucleoside diphosphate kinase